MATDTQGSVARSYPTQQILYLRKDFTFLSANGPTTALAVDNIVIGDSPGRRPHLQGHLGRQR